MTEELRSGFNEATQMLTETADEAIQKTGDAIQKTGAAAQHIADRSAEAAQESLQNSGKFTKKVVRNPPTMPRRKPSGARFERTPKLTG